MPKYVQFKVGGFWLYYTSKCLGEGIIHVHANEDQSLRRAQALKFWVYSDGSSKLLDYDKSLISITDKQIKEIQTWIKENIGIIEKLWMQGNPKSQFKQK